MGLKFILILDIILIFGKTLCQDHYLELSNSNCQNFLCLSSLTQKDCEKNNQFIVSNAGLYGCCPGCRTGVGMYTNRVHFFFCFLLISKFY